MASEPSEPKLCVVLWMEERSSFDEGTISINVRIERLNEDGDDRTYPFKSCSEHGKVVYRDIGTRAYFNRGQRPYGFGELEAWQVYSASVRDMKARIAAIEKTEKALAKIRESAGYSGNFEDFVVRLATALKSDAIFVSNKIRLLVSKRRNVEFLDDDRRAYTQYTRETAQWQLRSMAEVLTESEADAAQ